MDEADHFDFDLSVPRRRLSRDVVIAELKRYAAKNSPPHSAASFKKSIPAVSLDTVTRMFGSFKAACEAAGIEEVSTKRRYTDEELLAHFEGLCRYRKARGFGSVVPSINDFKSYKAENKGGVSHDAFTRRFGDYKQFLIRYQNFARGKLSRTELIEKSKITLKPQRGPISQKLRAETLHRLGNRCTSCGRHAAELGTSEQLEIDHIKPVALGGASEPENLTVKCSPCNRGKGARFEG